MPKAKVLQSAASAESQSEHLLAKAIVEAATQRGLQARVNGKLVFIGREKLWEERGVLPAPALQSAAEKFASTGQTMFFVGDETRVLGVLAVAEKIGGELQMSYRTELFPDEKLGEIKNIQSCFGTTVMIADGINDAPSLAAADLGISLGAAGTDVALETADVVLMADDLRHLPHAIALARQTRRIIT